MPHTLPCLSDSCCHERDKKQRGAASIRLTVRSLAWNWLLILRSHTHARTCVVLPGSLCVNFYVNKPVSFSGLEEHTLRCTKCVNILQTADRLTANHVSLSSAHLITLTAVAAHVAAAEAQQHVGSQSAVRLLPASLRRAFTDDWAFPWCPAEAQHFLFLCLTCWKKEMGHRASEVRPGWHKMTALIFALNAVSCCAVLGTVVINIVCQANRVKQQARQCCFADWANCFP